MNAPRYDMRECGIDLVQDLCRKHHGYGSAGKLAVYAFAVFEEGRPVAAYAWQPPPPGSAKSVCPEAPWGVLALSRMVAVPRTERALNHVSKPLRRQMKTLIDRGRWPALVTYSDEGQGHTGHVYKCSGWQATRRTRAKVFENPDTGERRSTYNAGTTGQSGAVHTGWTYIQRWEHHVAKGSADDHMESEGWYRVPTGKVWRSGNPRHTLVNIREIRDRVLRSRIATYGDTFTSPRRVG